MQVFSLADKLARGFYSRENLTLGFASVLQAASFDNFFHTTTRSFTRDRRIILTRAFALYISA